VQDESAYAAKDKRSKGERDAYAAIYRKAPIADAFAQRWSVWAAGFGGSQTTDGNAPLGSNSVTSRIYGTAVGADYHFSPFTLAGFALAGGGTNFSIANARHRTLICSRRERMCATPSARLTSLPHSPMAGRTSPPIVT
jgi:uncharacterized protein with beta-barrel porin domain